MGWRRVLTCPHAASLVDSWQGGCMGKGSLSSRFQHAGWGVVGNGDSDRLPFPVLASSDPMDRQEEGASCHHLFAWVPRHSDARSRLHVSARPCDRTPRAHLTQAAVRLHTTEALHTRCCTFEARLPHSLQLALRYRLLRLQMLHSSGPLPSTRSAE